MHASWLYGEKLRWLVGCVAGRWRIVVVEMVWWCWVASWWIRSAGKWIKWSKGWFWSVEALCASYWSI